MVILFILIFPDKNPKISFPSLNTTLKKAFGKASITLPSFFIIWLLFNAYMLAKNPKIVNTTESLALC